MEGDFASETASLRGPPLPSTSRSRRTLNPAAAKAFALAITCPGAFNTSDRPLSAKAIRKQMLGLSDKGLVGGTLYFDAQFDDARLIINMAQTAYEQGAVVLNYFEVTGF